jgi:hypothetical protein
MRCLPSVSPAYLTTPYAMIGSLGRYVCVSIRVFDGEIKWAERLDVNVAWRGEGMFYLRRLWAELLF